MCKSYVWVWSGFCGDFVFSIIGKFIRWREFKGFERFLGGKKYIWDIGNK